MSLGDIAMHDQATADSRLPLIFFIAWLLITLIWWALAFAPLPAEPPNWLVLARQVCFGSTPAGLPEGYGLLTLFAGPGSMLGFLLVVWGQPLRTNLQALSRMRQGKLVIGILLALPIVGAVWVGQRIVTVSKISAAFTPLSRTAPLPAYYPRIDRPAPELRLIDQHGHMTSLSDHRGDIMMLTFAFGHCPTLCSTTVQTARAAATDAAVGVTPGLWVVTLDPWRDTPGSLPGLAAKWRLDANNMRVLSAEVENVLAVLDAYNVPHQRDLRTGDIAHSALVYIIDPNGRIAYAFNNPSRDWLVEAVRRTAQSKIGAIQQPS